MRKFNTSKKIKETFAPSSKKKRIDFFLRKEISDSRLMVNRIATSRRQTISKGKKAKREVITNANNYGISKE